MKKILFIAALLISSLQIFAQANEPIEIDIPSKMINGTKLKLKARLFTMTYNQLNKSLTLNWQVSYYADSAGAYGQKIELPGVTSYFKQSVANNTVFVDPVTGAFVEEDAEGHYPPGSIGQYDYFYNLAENHDINVHDLIRVYGAAVTDW